MRLSLGNLGAVAAACLMAGLIGLIAVTGRWPVDAPRTHLDVGSILSFPIERVTHVEIVAGGQHILLSRRPGGAWRIGDAPARAVLADHINAARKRRGCAAPH